MGAQDSPRLTGWRQLYAMAFVAFAAFAIVCLAPYHAHETKQADGERFKTTNLFVPAFSDSNPEQPNDNEEFLLLQKKASLLLQDEDQNHLNHRKLPPVVLMQKKAAQQQDEKDQNHQNHQTQAQVALADERQTLPNVLKKLAEFEETVGDPATAAEATKLEEELDDGTASQDESTVIDLVNKASSSLTPEAAAANGMEITSTDLDEIENPHHLVQAEETHVGAFQGDMVPGDDQQLQLFEVLAETSGRRSNKTLTSAGKPWTNGVFKYCLAPDLTNDARTAWAKAIKQFKKSVPCIQWQELSVWSGSSASAEGARQCSESPAVFVTSANDGCWSYVGELSHKTSQTLNLASPGCTSVGTTIHEILHALGQAHEQSRPDRDQYIYVDLDNTVEDNQFKISPTGDTTYPYDILSLMHYGVEDFATDRTRPVIYPKPAAYAKYTSDQTKFSNYKPGNRIGMAQTDANQLADLYKTVVSSCSAMTLGGKSACVDKKIKGKAWTDTYGQTCASYVSMVNSGQLPSCGKPYGSGNACCGCGGGLMVQEWNDDSLEIPTSSPSSPSPPPAASKTCKDSTTYRDPRDLDTCSGWKGYSCDGHWFSAELKQNCPQACNVPCSTSTALVGKIISLHNNIFNRFVRMNGDKMESSDKCDLNKLGHGWTWERFNVVDAGNDQIVLHSAVQNRFVRLNGDKAGTSPTRSVGDGPFWDSERFTVVDAGNGYIALHNAKHNRYLRMHDDRNRPWMDASAVKSATDLPGDWTLERFIVVDAGAPSL